MGLGPSLPSIDESSKGAAGGSAAVEPVVTEWLEILAQTRERPLKKASGGQGLDLSDTRLTDEVVEALVEGPHGRFLEHIVELDCSCNAALTTFPDRPLRRLQTLDLGFCVGLLDGAVFRIARNCHALVALGLTDCDQVTDASVIAAARHCPLRVLNLRGCRHVSDAALTAIGRSCGNLESLNLAFCARVTDNGIFSLVSGCRRLTSLNLLNCGNATDEAGCAIARGFPALQVLVLACCEKITDRSVSAIASASNELRSLNLSFCENVSGRGIAEVAATCPALSELLLAGCAIDDHDVRNIVGDYSKLHTFILAGCPITDASLTTIASCPWLFSLSLVGCPNISNEAVVALRNECKGLQVLR